jgi:hypothetical protein
MARLFGMIAGGLAVAAGGATALDWMWAARVLQGRADSAAMRAADEILHGRRGPPRPPVRDIVSLERGVSDGNHAGTPGAVRAVAQSIWRPVLLRPLGVEVPITARATAAALKDPAGKNAWLLRLE